MARPARLRSLTIDWDEVEDERVHPFNIASIAALTGELDLDHQVVCFVGENGSGKSTLLEAIAVALEFNPEGGSRNFAFSTRDDEYPLSDHVRVARSGSFTSDFFLRAESYFNVATEIDKISEADKALGHRPLSKVYGGSPHLRSHGESFLALVERRFGKHGLYLLDEPESALSFAGELRLAKRITELISAGSQFLIATHSPILPALALGEADVIIHHLTSEGPATIEWGEVPSVVATKAFLADPSSEVESWG